MNPISVSKHKRVSRGSKVRTGCKTCKKRRVKCDETKPVCLRCQKYEVECEGYSFIPPPRHRIHAEPIFRGVFVRIAPKPTPPSKVLAASQAIEPVTLAARSLSVPWQPMSSIFANEQEFRYFGRFCEKTIANLAPYFKVSLWDRIILQACESTPSIKHAVIAIGALDMTMDAAQRNQGLSPTLLHDDRSIASVHHRFALMEYGKAIKQMKHALSSGTEDVRTALIACLLTICFESLNGDIQSAMTQVRTGLKLLKEWRLINTTNSALALSGSSTTDLVRSELVQAFTRLDNDTVLLMDAEPLEIDLTPSASSHIGQNDIIPAIPVVFETLEDARAHWEFLLGRMLHWIANAYAWGSPSTDESRARSSPLHPSLSSAKINTNDRPAPPSMSYATSFASARQSYLSTFRSWHAAFRPLLLQARSPHGRELLVAATALELTWKSMYTTLCADHFAGETAYDAHVEDFSEVVELAETLVALESEQSSSSIPRKAQYTFDGKFIISVYGVALKCRDPIVRRKAIRLLESRSRREGIMDSELSARLATLQMRIEEAGAVPKPGGYIPEEARIRGIKTTYDMMTRTGKMKYLKMIEASNGKFKQYELDFAW